MARSWKFLQSYGAMIITLLLFLFTGGLSGVIAQPLFGAGNLVIHRVGDGAQTLSSKSVKTVLLEISTSGTIIDSIQVPFTGTNKFVVQGSSSNDGMITLSTNRQRIIMYGYKADTGIAAVSGISGVLRTVLSIDSTKTFLELASGPRIGNARCAASNGSNVWVTASTGGLFAGMQTGGNGLMDTISNAISNLRAVGIFNNQLYFSTSSFSPGIHRVGIGTPNTGPITPTLVIPMLGTPNQFSFNSDTTICYVAIDASLSGVKKYTRSGSVWNLVDSVAGSPAARALVVDWSQSNPIIYFNNGTNLVNKVTDIGTNLISQPVTTIYTAPSNTAVRGISFTPKVVSSGPTSAAPAVLTNSATSIASTSATLRGNVTDSGSATVTERGVVYATTANPTTTTGTKVVIGSGIGSFSQNVTGLTASTTYHVRAYAINSVGTSYGGDSTFTTSSNTVQPLSVKSYAPQSGNVGSSVTIKGTGFINVTKVWFGPAPAASFMVVNDSTINAVVPDNAYMGNIAVATTTGFKIGKEYFYVKNPQNVMVGNTGQTGVYFLKDGKLHGQYIYNFDDGQLYRYCPVEMPPKGSLRGKTISQLSTSGTWGLIALASDNTVHTQGNNSFRQLGDSSTVSNRALPVNITNKGDLNGKTVIQVLAGSNRFYALTSDGIVCSWGKDTLGSLGNGAGNGMVWTPTSIAGRGSLAGKTIIKLCKGADAVYETNVFAIASDGTVHGWGPNINSSIGVTHSNVIEDPVQITQSGILNGKVIVDIDSKQSATILLDEDGKLYGMGSSMNLGLSGAVNRTTPDLLDMGSSSSLYNKRVLSMVLNRTGGSAIVVDTAGKVHAMGNNALSHLGTGNSNNAVPPSLVEATTSSIAGKVVVGLAQTNMAYYVTTSDNQMHVFGFAGNYQLLNGLGSPNAPIAQPIGNPKPVPSFDATNLVFSNITSSSATIKCTPGSGVGRMIVVKANNVIDTIGPAQGVTYTPQTNMSGTSIDTTGRVVYRAYGDSVNITGLVNGTLYHVAVFEYDTFSNPCKYDIYRLGTPLMGSFIATSGPQQATVTTSSATSIATNSATLGGNVTATGGAAVTERGVVYATSANPTTTTGTKVIIGSGLGTFSQNVSGLTASTTYHVRAYAINSVGTSYGGDSTFTTSPVPPGNAPIVTTGSPSSVLTTSAILSGNVTDSGTAAVTQRGIVYSTSANPTTISGTIVIMGSGIGSFSQNVSGLNTGTTYHVRAYAINSVGTSYGADSVFTTSTVVTPLINVVGSLTPFSACSGTASAEQTFSVSGVNLSGDITINGAPGMELSLTSGTGFTSSLVLTATTGSVPSTTIYVRLNSTTQGLFSGNITSASAGATSQNVAFSSNVKPSPAAPVISIQPASPVCSGAEYLNFGASAAPASGVTYLWSTTANASLYAQGSTRQYALVSFPDSGNVKVTLTATENGCESKAEVMIAVSADTAHHANVRYFGNNFVCQANLVQSYQWGYDELPTLKGNIVTGEINQNYYNPSPDLANKSYWVISAKSGCNQKTYYNTPSGHAEQNLVADHVLAYPNPFSDVVTLSSVKGLQGASIVISDINGKTIATYLSDAPSLNLPLNELSSGVYFLNVTGRSGEMSNLKIVKF